MSDCNPRDFFNVDFSSRSELERLVILSEITEEQYREVQRQHHGEMTIPYINVPAKGSFEELKKKTNQVKRFLQLDYSRQAETTLLSMSLEALNVEAYKACLATSRARISVDSQTIFQSVVNLTVHWNSERGETGRISDPVVTQGRIKNRFDRSIPHNGASILQLERDVSKSSTVSLTIKHFPTEVTLPPRPVFRLVMENVVFPPPGTPAPVSTSDVRNGYMGNLQTPRYPAPAGTEFLLDSWEVVEAQNNAVDMGSWIKPFGNESFIGLDLFADSGVKNRAAVVSGRVAARILKLEKIQY